MKVLKHGFLISFLLLVHNGLAQKKRFTIHFTYFQSYCEGARPTPEMEAETKKAKAYANKTVVWVSAKGKIDSAKTNAEGILILKLKKGIYSFYEDWRYYLDTPGDLDISNFDKTCLIEEWQKVTTLVTVTRKEVQIVPKNEIRSFCSFSLPCLLQNNVAPSRPN